MNRVLQIAAIVAVAVSMNVPAVAAPAKKQVRRPAALVAPVPAPVDVPMVVRAPGEMMIPAEAKLRATTPAEADANALWNLRAALNIAALQCQFSPFLATVATYNAVLRQHGEEFDRARVTLVDHFRRYDKAAAQNSFDQFTTRTYNSYSTLDAQLSLCEKAATVGREALIVRKGQLAPFALQANLQIRAALIPVRALALLGAVDVTPVEVPLL